MIRIPTTRKYPPRKPKNKSMDDSFPDFFGPQKDRVDRMLDDVLPPEEENKIAEAMRYTVLAGGKRIRGVLVLEAARLGNSDSESNAQIMSAVVELLHSYTLVHDDLPMMDDDEFRRGQPSCHVKFDEATAVLSGNALQSLAYRSLCDLDCSRHKLVLILERLSKMIGYDGILDGQMRDLELEGIQADEQTVLDMYDKKTGYLIGFALELGAIVGGLKTSDQEILRTIGRKLGTAFQIHDDVLEQRQDPDKLGKDVDSDRTQEKSTLIQLVGEESAKDRASSLVDEGESYLDDLPYDTERLSRLAHFLVQRNY